MKQFPFARAQFLLYQAVSVANSLHFQVEEMPKVQGLLQALGELQARIEFFQQESQNENPDKDTGQEQK